MATEASRPTVARYHLIAEIVSFVAHPVLILVAAVGVISWRYAGGDFDRFWRWWGLGSFLLLGPGFLYSAYTWAREKAIDVDLSRRQDRLIPLLLSTLGAVIVSFLISSRLDNHNLLVFSYVVAGMLTALTLITSVWKISLHAATLSALVTLLIVLDGSLFAVLYLTLIPVAWSRRVLKEHTRAQLIGGVLVGAAVTAAAMLVFRG
ncbi:MAG TPA: hypothetical protein VLE93_03105 [Candidatus Saccharimonadales bacterium]|nr:hypothetical protein [Candidatus Saccharimonadales bacterium]